MVFVTTPGIKQAEMVAASAQQHQQQAIHCALLFYLLFSKLLFTIQNGSLSTVNKSQIGRKSQWKCNPSLTYHLRSLEHEISIPKTSINHFE